MKLTSTIRRKFRIRNKLKKVSNKDRLRLSISRSTKNISAQIIDDRIRKTIVSASSNEKEIKSNKLNKTKMSIAIGEILAKRATEKKISKVFFDRGGYKYHGRIKALADSLRKNGLNF